MLRWIIIIIIYLLARPVEAVKLEGGSALALAGKNSVVLAMDQRIGTRLLSTYMDMITSSGQLLLSGSIGKRGSRRVLKVNGKVLLGMVGYDSMAKAFFDLLRAELNLRSMKLEQHDFGGEQSCAISPKALSMLVSHLLYYRFKGVGTAPIIAGLDENDVPVLCTQDSLGAYSFQKDFVAIGSSSKALLGACEALYQPGLEGEALVHAACQCLRAGLERDCQSGYGLIAYLVTPQGISTTIVEGRMD